MPDQSLAINDIAAVQKPASYSVLRKMKRSAAHCKEYMDNPDEATPAMTFGKMFHTMLLQPNKLNDRYHFAGDDDPRTPRKDNVQRMIDAIMQEKFDELFYLDNGDLPKKPVGKTAVIVDALRAGAEMSSFKAPLDVSKRSLEGKATHAQFEEDVKKNGWIVVEADRLEIAVEYYAAEIIIKDREIVKPEDLRVAKNYSEYLKFIGDKLIVKEEDRATAQLMCESIKRHPIAQRLLRGEAEKKFDWIDEDTKYPCKTVIDFVSDSGYLVDLKSSGDASEFEFSRSISKFGYHIQQAVTVDGFKAATGKDPKAFLFIVVEKTAPYAVATYALDQAGEDEGREEYKYLLKRFAECMSTNEWPAYSAKVQTIELPKWHR